MPSDVLEFEEPIGVLQKEIEALSMLPRTEQRDGEIDHARAETLARRGYGDAAIRADLARRGVDRELVREAVGALEPELSRARRAFAASGAGPRALRRLAGRGFEPDTVRELSTFADGE